MGLLSLIVNGAQGIRRSTVIIDKAAYLRAATDMEQLSGKKRIKMRVFDCLLRCFGMLCGEDAMSSFQRSNENGNPHLQVIAIIIEDAGRRGHLDLELLGTWANSNSQARVLDPPVYSGVLRVVLPNL